MEFGNLHSLRSASNRCFRQALAGLDFGLLAVGSRFVFSGKEGLTGGLDRPSFVRAFEKSCAGRNRTPALVTENGQ
jgi:hypothetical protein